MATSTSSPTARSGEDGGQFVPFWQSPGRSTVAVVWFENRLFEKSHRYVEQAGAVHIEVENYSNTHDGSWLERGANGGFGGHGYMIDHFALSGPARGFNETRGLSYVAEVAGGNYHIWVRRWIPSTWGSRGRGDDLSDSAWLGIDGALVGQTIEGGAQDEWQWVRVGEVNLTPGEHTLQLRVREGGVALDAVYITRDAGAAPP